MSNIYLKVTVEEKNWRSQNFGFPGLNNLSRCQFWEAPTHADITDFKISCCNLKNRVLGPKLCVAFLLFSLWKELWHFKVKKFMHFVEQKYINFNKNGTESKMENPTHSFRKTKLVPQLTWESQIKRKTVMSWS